MRSRHWLILTLLALPTLVFSQKRAQTPAQTTARRMVHSVTEADVVGAWSAELDYPGHPDKEKVGVILWPDHLWVYTGGAFMTQNHGGARWRLVGDTLWLGDDYEPYFHPMTNNRWSSMLDAHGQFGIMDQAIISRRPPYPVSDSIYWSNAFRDTTTACSGPNDHLGLLSVALATLMSIGARGNAQVSELPRLRVRPRTMATGTQNPAVGEYPVDSVPGYLVSVPTGASR